EYRAAMELSTKGVQPENSLKPSNALLFKVHRNGVAENDKNRRRIDGFEWKMESSKIVDYYGKERIYVEIRCLKSEECSNWYADAIIHIIIVNFKNRGQSKSMKHSIRFNHSRSVMATSIHWQADTNIINFEDFYLNDEMHIVASVRVTSIHGD
ncbi:hypothetical protein PFISCL1PPCAC_7659, partial [Pristionchus fissidentatus]